MNWIPSGHDSQVLQLSQRVPAQTQPKDRNQIAHCIHIEATQTHSHWCPFIINDHYCCRRLTVTNNNSSCSFQEIDSTVSCTCCMKGAMQIKFILSFCLFHSCDLLYIRDKLISWSMYRRISSCYDHFFLRSPRCFRPTDQSPAVWPQALSQFLGINNKTGHVCKAG